MDNKAEKIVQTPKQEAWQHTWTLYGLSYVTGMRNKLRFAWSFEYDGLELNVWHRPKSGTMLEKRWREYGPDYTVGKTEEGLWYVYALYEGYDGNSGPYTDDIHLGEFPGFETAFFAMLTYMAKEMLNNIYERRYERKMDRIHEQIEREGLLDPI